MALDLAAAYGETHGHLAELAHGLSEHQLATIVPASPAWSVLDVVAHVTGLASDVVNGRIPAELDVVAGLTDAEQAARRDGLTADQVETRRGRSIADLLDEWDASARSLLEMFRGQRAFPRPMPFADAVLTTDVSVHAQDVRGTLGVPGDRESAAVSVSLVSYTTAVAIRLAQRGLPALRLRYEGKERVIGEGDPGATLEAERYEIVRALSGRRSRSQIRSMTWRGDPDPYVDLIPAYGPRDDDVVDLTEPVAVAASAR